MKSDSVFSATSLALLIDKVINDGSLKISKDFFCATARYSSQLVIFEFSSKLMDYYQSSPSHNDVDFQKFILGIMRTLLGFAFNKYYDECKEIKEHCLSFETDSLSNNIYAEIDITGADCKTNPLD